jgi:aminopeptidase N
LQALVNHPDFTLKNPNRLRSLVSVFTMNMTKFHAKSGAAYTFLGDICLEVDGINAQASAAAAAGACHRQSQSLQQVLA